MTSSSHSTTTNIRSIISHGPDGIPVDIECHLSNSLPSIVIVGYAAKTVDESRERLRGAFSNSGLQLPRKRISINLAPADIPKDSSSLDLAIAVAILAAQSAAVKPPSEHAFIGELGLDGSVRPVRGIIGKLISGRRNGVSRFYIPAGNMAQAMLVPHIELVPVGSLRQLYELFTSPSSPDGPPTAISTHDGQTAAATAPQNASNFNEVSLSDIVGQDNAKRALTIAAAGGHNVLLSGPPGTGKSMLAKALAGLLPPLTHEEMLEVTHLHSLAGRDYDRLITSRPFRAPHHSASHVAIIGGGTPIRPGETSLAHRGVLFFDEMPEFARATLESLRQPLEDRTVTVSRAKESNQYPANFILVATANPCPCGHYTSSQVTKRRCQCSPYIVRQYQRKLSGPLLDRIDICVNVEQVDHANLLTSTYDHDYTASIKRLITEVRSVQQRRFADSPVDPDNPSGHKLNSDMTNRDIKRLARLSPKAKPILDDAGTSMQLSARAYMRCLKVARTIADLDGSDNIEPEHLTEALQYRADAGSHY